jgi:hypothetical protein
VSEVQGPVSPDPIHDQIKLCRRPFTAAAIKWKIQTNPKEGKPPRAAVVAFIDARLAGERLNATGIPWSSRYTAVPGGLLCTISVRHPRTGEVVIERCDVGWSKDVSSARDHEKNMVLKTGYSDALKRAAVHFGVGVSLYALPIKYLSGDDDEITKRGTNWYITSKGTKALNAHYNAWLKEHGVPTFGEVVDHGDMDDSQGDVESTDRANDESVAKDTPAAAPKAADTTNQQAPAEVRPVTAGQVDKLLNALAASSKKVADVQTFLASKGVEGFNVEGTLEQLTELSVSFEIGKELYVWLKKNAADAS